MGLFPQVAKGTARAKAMLDRLSLNAQDVFGRDPVQHGRNLRHRALNCASCQSRDACDRLLATVTSLEAAPEFCPNKDSLAALMRR